MILKIIISIIAGALASWFVPMPVKINIWMKMALGMCGAVIANFLGSMTGLYASDNSGAGLVSATIGAIILLTIIKLMSGRE